MNAVDEMMVLDALGQKCMFSESRDWLMDHRFLVNPDENSGAFLRDFSFGDGEFVCTVNVEFNIDEGTCRAYISGVGGTIFYKLYENGKEDDMPSLVEMEYDECGVHDEGFIGEFAGDLVMECLRKAIRIHEKCKDMLMNSKKSRCHVFTSRAGCEGRRGVR